MSMNSSLTHMDWASFTVRRWYNWLWLAYHSAEVSLASRRFSAVWLTAGFLLLGSACSGLRAKWRQLGESCHLFYMGRWWFRPIRSHLISHLQSPISHLPTDISHADRRWINRKRWLGVMMSLYPPPPPLTSAPTLCGVRTKTWMELFWANWMPFCWACGERPGREAVASTVSKRNVTLKRINANWGVVEARACLRAFVRVLASPAVCDHLHHRLSLCPPRLVSPLLSSHLLRSTLLHLHS